MGRPVGIRGIRTGVFLVLVLGGLGYTIHARVQGASGNLPAKRPLPPSRRQPDTSLITNAVQVSVKQYGAIGNGIANDTVAIQRAIQAVMLWGGGTVFFPAGTYRLAIQPELGRALTLSRNLTLQGESAAKSVLKLGDRQGNYHAILAGASNSTDLSNLTLRHLTIDANALNNPVPSEQALQGSNQARFMLRVYVGKNIRIENCRWTNFKNVNAITLNNDLLVSDLVVQNNQFDGVGGGTVDHDHSTLYVHGKRSLIANNRFTSRNGAGTVGARTAIETHGDRHQVLNNQITGYTYGMNITGIASSSKDQVIQGNQIRAAHTGIVLWSYLPSGAAGSPGLDNLTIHNNQIDLDVLGWRKLWGDSPNQGIGLEANSNGAIHGLKITQNTITFRNVKDPGRASDTLAAGLILWRVKPLSIPFRAILIVQNTVTGPLSSGLYISDIPIQSLQILQNTLVNTGQSGYRFHPHYRSGMVIEVNQVSMQVNENRFIDNQPVNTMPIGMIWEGRCTAACTERNNLLFIRSGAKVPLLLRTP